MTKSSLELGNAFLVLRLFIKKKMKASGRNNNNDFRIVNFFPTYFSM
jgi:hypothetical protein